MVLITIVPGANLNQLITGGPHIVELIQNQPGYQAPNQPPKAPAGSVLLAANSNRLIVPAATMTSHINGVRDLPEETLRRSENHIWVIFGTIITLLHFMGNCLGITSTLLHFISFYHKTSEKMVSFHWQMV